MFSVVLDSTDSLKTSATERPALKNLIALRRMYWPQDELSRVTALDGAYEQPTEDDIIFEGALGLVHNGNTDGGCSKLRALIEWKNFKTNVS